jgi:hypothetical protein
MGSDEDYERPHFDIQTVKSLAEMHVKVNMGRNTASRKWERTGKWSIQQGDRVI